MSYKEIIKDLESEKAKSVYVLHGEERYIIDSLVSKIKEKYVDESFETFNYSQIDGKEYDAEYIVNACETLPFMSEKKVVVIEECPVITTSKEGKKEEEERLLSYIERVNDSTCAVFVNKESKIDGRKKLVKAIKKVGKVVEIKKLKSDELSKWVKKEFFKRQVTISLREIHHFIEVSGYEENNSEKTLYDMENEIKKICSYAESKEITLEIIDKIMTKSLHNNIFRLVDNIGKKRHKEAIKLFNEMLMENEPVIRIMFMITRQFRMLFMTKLMVNKGYMQSDISKKLGVQGFVARNLISQVKNFSEEELRKSLDMCLEVDRAIKKGLMNDKIAVEMLIMSF